MEFKPGTYVRIVGGGSSLRVFGIVRSKDDHSGLYNVDWYTEPNGKFWGCDVHAPNNLELDRKMTRKKIIEDVLK